MNKKTIILLSALAIVIISYFLLNRNISNTITGNDRNFEFSSTDKIDKVFLSNKASKKFVTLTKQDEKNWLVNGKFKVSMTQIELLFSTLKNLRVKRPVSKNEKNTVVKDMALNATKVEIYENGKISKVFYVGQNTQNEMATYFFMEGGKEPYVCYIPGDDSYLNARFFTDVVAWRSKNIFSSKAEDIQKIAVDWIDTPERSFVIDNSQKEPVLMSGGKTFKNNVEVNLNKLRSYLNLWENLSFEGFPISLDAHQIDSVSKTRPFLVMQLTDKKGKTTKLTVHRKSLKKDSRIQTDMEGNPLEFEMEKYYAFINDNNKEIVQIQDYVFGKVMKYRTDFMLKQDTR
jgi:hypothetical protein